MRLSSLTATPKATYGVITNNTTQGIYGANFLDARLRRILDPIGGVNLQDITSNRNGQAVGANQITYGNTTATQPGTSSTTAANATWASGELGNDYTQLYEGGVASTAYSRFGSSNPSRANLAVVDSSHGDRTKVLAMNAGVLYSTSLAYPNPVSPFDARTTFDLRPAFTAITALSSVATMQGSASYNAARKELVAMAYVSTSRADGVFDLAIWKNVDLNANGVDVSTIAPTPSVAFKVDLKPLGWVDSNDSSEGMYRIAPVLADDGSIFISYMQPSAALRLLKIARNAGDTAIATTVVAENPITTGFGYNSSSNFYGQRKIMSRDRRLTMMFCAYYYYGAGVATVVVDRRTSTGYLGPRVGDPGNGVSVVKWRDDGFLLHVNTNSYAATSSTYVPYAITADALAAGPIPASNIYLPVAGPNTTTDYPALGMVWNYDLQPLSR